MKTRHEVLAMNKSKKVIASLAAVGALAFGSIAMAAPWHPGADPAPQPEMRGCLMAPEKAPAPVPPALRSMPSYKAMGKILTLTAEQQPLWAAYVNAREALRAPLGAKAGEEPPADMQERLERRAERAQLRADAIKAVATARAELVKSLSVEQKYVLEQFETARRDHGMHRPGPRPEFRTMPGWHHFHDGCPRIR